MNKYHMDINGEPAKCNAKSEESCPRAKEGSPHGYSPDDVQAQYESQNQEKITTGLSKQSYPKTLEGKPLPLFGDALEKDEHIDQLHDSAEELESIDLGKEFDEGGMFEHHADSISRKDYVLRVQKVNIEGQEIYASTFDDGDDQWHENTQLFATREEAFNDMKDEEADWYTRWD